MEALPFLPTTHSGTDCDIPTDFPAGAGTWSLVGGAKDHPGSQLVSQGYRRLSRPPKAIVTTTNLSDAGQDQTEDQIEGHTEDQIEGHTEDQTEDRIEDRTEDQTEDQTEDRIEDRTEDHTEQAATVPLRDLTVDTKADRTEVFAARAPFDYQTVGQNRGSAMD
ncbi:hypothetical protein PG993_009003 [Apiospora rasikravindrae]|uniref:Uncharacterized protein n=1 Tax=Apiospora rasikravindrae TaxID=990691 RepID=A0ABR1SKG7_9PEZI